jgi:nickel-dependent lactate racemase
MVEVWMPYGDTEIVARIPDENFLSILTPRVTQVKRPPQQIEAMLERSVVENFTDLAQGKNSACLIIDPRLPEDLVSPVVEQIIAKLQGAGIPRESISAIVASAHSGLIGFISREKVTGWLKDKVNIIPHDPQKSQITRLPSTAHGNLIQFNSVFASAGVKLILGLVTQDVIYGFSTPSTLVMRTVASKQTITRNASLIFRKLTYPGVFEENPAAQDSEEACKLVGSCLAVALLTSHLGELIEIISGKPASVAEDSISYLREAYGCEVKRRADIVVASAGGMPWDSSLFSAAATIQVASSVLKEGGALILAAECSERFGDESFRRWALMPSNPKVFEASLKRSPCLEGHVVWLIRKFSESHKTYLVSTMPDYETRRIGGFSHARTVNTAIQSALRSIGRDSKIIAIPYASHTLPYFSQK